MAAITLFNGPNKIVYSYDPYSDLENERVAQKVDHTGRVIDLFRTDLKSGKSIDEVRQAVIEYWNNLVHRQEYIGKKLMAFVNLSELALIFNDELKTQYRNLIKYDYPNAMISRGIEQVTELYNSYSSGERIWGIEYDTLNRCKLMIEEFMKEIG